MAQQNADKAFRELWGRVPQKGELFDVQRRVGVSLSPDGGRAAVALVTPNADLVEIWRLPPSIREAYREQWFRVDGHRDMAWHPDGRLIATVTDTQGYRLLDTRTGKDSLIVATYPGALAWAGNSDDIIGKFRFAGERPQVVQRVNVWSGEAKAFEPPWHGEPYRAIRAFAVSSDGDFAFHFVDMDNRGGIAIYRPKSEGRGWSQEATIRASGNSSLRLVKWLTDRRLAYAVLSSTGGGSDRTYDVTLTTCDRQGSRRRQLLTLSDIGPPSYYPEATEWLSVSADGRRVAFFRNDRLFIHAVPDSDSETEEE